MLSAGSPAARLAALPAHRAALKRYEKPLPGHQVQIGVKFIAPIGATPAGQSTATSPAGGRRKKYCQFTAIDDCTRLRVLRIYGPAQPEDRHRFADYVPEKLPIRPKLTGIAVGRPGRNAAHLVPERGCLPEGRAPARGRHHP
jgi:hypothetical protein